MLNHEEITWLAQELGATYELMGKQIQPAALAILVRDLSCYDVPQLRLALARIRQEHTGQLTPSVLMGYVEQSYGRVSANEAYAIAMEAKDERATVVWTNEIAEAWAAAVPLLSAGDKFAARQAFVDVYGRVTAMARLERRLPSIELSEGHDAEMRRAAIEKAQARGLLSRDITLLPAPVQALLTLDQPRAVPGVLALAAPEAGATPAAVLEAKQQVAAMVKEIKDGRTLDRKREIARVMERRRTRQLKRETARKVAEYQGAKQ